MHKPVQQTGSLWKAALKVWPLWLLATVCLALGIALMTNAVLTHLSLWWRDKLALTTIVFGLYSAALAAFMTYVRRHYR